LTQGRNLEDGHKGITARCPKSAANGIEKENVNSCNKVVCGVTLMFGIGELVTCMMGI